MRVQLEVAVRNVETIWTGRVKQGDIVWVDEKAARHLLENGICKFIDWQEKEKSAPPEVAQEQAPKFAAARMAGRLIDSRLSNRSGPVLLSSVSAGVLVSPKRI